MALTFVHYTAHAGLQQKEFGVLSSDGDAFTISVGSEARLREVLSHAALGWQDRRVVELVADMKLGSTLVIESPVRIRGRCRERPGELCTISAAAGVATPLLHYRGPAAVAQLENVRVMGGSGTRTLAGGITASNHSAVDLVSVEVAHNRGAASGGGLRVDSNARLNLVGSMVGRNVAARCGGGAYVRAAHLHLDASSLVANVAISGGGGVCLDHGARLTAEASALEGNLLASRPALTHSSSSGGSGADIHFWDGDKSAAYLDPLPPIMRGLGGEGRSSAPGTLSVSSGGGEVQHLSVLAARIPAVWRAAVGGGGVSWWMWVIAIR